MITTTITVKTSENSEAIEAYAKSIPQGTVATQRGETGTALKYSAMFAPNVSFMESTKEGQTVYPGSFAYLSCFAKHSQRFPTWFAMAGSVRGVLPYSEVEVTKEFGQADIDLLESRDELASRGVNVITNIRPYGNIVWGNRTLEPLTSDDNGVVGLRASQFLNIRNLCCDIKKTLYRAARRFTFEPNSDTLWYNFVGAIKPLLEEMRTGQGIRGYKIEKVTTDQKAVLKAVIKIIPIEAVEDFDLTVELSDSIEVTE